MDYPLPGYSSNPDVVRCVAGAAWRCARTGYDGGWRCARTGYVGTFNSVEAGVHRLDAEHVWVPSLPHICSAMVGVPHRLHLPSYM